MPFYKSRVDIIEVNKFVKEIEPTYLFIRSRNILNKIRDLFKVKLYTIRSETKKRGRERERNMLTLALTGGHK